MEKKKNNTTMTIVAVVLVGIAVGFLLIRHLRESKREKELERVEQGYREDMRELDEIRMRFEYGNDEEKVRAYQELKERMRQHGMYVEE